ncbi:MAG TPA: PEGA domain-containing protein [Kofleriaceae bacterium]
MTLRLLPLLLVAALGTRAHGGTVGVVVTGDPRLSATLSTQLETWLRTHGHTLGEALPPDAVSSLLNCMVIDDEGCARGIVDARAKTDSVVFGEVRAPRTRASNATTLIVYWLVKGKEPVGMRQACEDCTPELLQSTLDDMLNTVVGASGLARGRLVLSSKPAGLTVMLDNTNVGITPLERDVPAGPHTIVLMSRGRKVGERTLKIQPEVTAEITVPVRIPKDEPPDRPSHVLPGFALAVGGAAIVAGAILYFTSDVDDGTKFTYYDNKPVGLGVAAGGVAVAALGAYLWFRTGARDSSPVVAIDIHHQAGFFGWSRAF